MQHTALRRLLVGLSTQCAWFALAAAAILLIAAPRAQGDVTWSTTSSGDWSVASNWAAPAPAIYDYAYIANGGTATITQSGAVCYGLYLGDTTSGQTDTVQMYGGDLTATEGVWVGYNGTGAFIQSGGTHANGGLYVGYYGYSGAYGLSGSAVLSAPYESVGYGGTGSFSQIGGTNNGGELDIGSYQGSSGLYILSSSGVLSAATEYIGTSPYSETSGTGTFQQTAGSNSVNYLAIGNQGSYQFSGGTRQISGGGLANQGVFDATQSTGLLTVAGSSILDLSQATLLNTGSMSLSIGPNSLLLLPAGFNTSAFLNYYKDPAGAMHNVGTPLTILPGQGFMGLGLDSAIP